MGQILASTSLRPPSFWGEFLGGDRYELVVEDSGLFLRVDDSERLYLEFFDQSLNEQFILTKVAN
jgi:hypothetical protein